jgi:NADH-quinone oxidoreductase subunit M
VLSIIGIVYAGLICWVQTDVKKLVAYSSVAHLGFCILGMFSFNNAGLVGSVMYMINHGLSTGALFLLIGMVYERYHTRSMKELGGLAAKMPIWATFMVFFTMASVGLPGLNGFVSEFLCILGAFQAGTFEGTQPGRVRSWARPWYAFAAGTGMIIAAIYLLYMVGNVVWGKLVEPHGHDHGHEEKEEAQEGGLPTDLCWREIGILVPLAVACLWLGLFPRPVLETLRHPAFRCPA